MDPEAPADPLAELNGAQRAAVLHGDAPLLLVAGAGSGKTNTLAHRVAHLIAKGADPARVLLLTFSRRAAQEMERRAGRVLARSLRLSAAAEPPPLPWAGTFHGIGARLLREYAPRVGLEAAFTIHDRGDSADLMGLTRHEIGLDTRHRRFPLKGTCLAIYSRTVNGCDSLRATLAAAFPWCAEWENDLKRLFGAYVETKLAQNVLDYDDLLSHWAAMLEDPAIAQEIGARFDHVLVDEYQDTNRLQAAILRRLRPDGRGLMVVGDDAQAIYSFRGATVRNILDFGHDFTGAAMLALEQNYRSTQAILDASNAVMEHAAERHAKVLWTARRGGQPPSIVTVPDETGQARWVADSVLAARESGIALKSQAVLFRTASHSAALELELARRDIPFVKYGGLRFLEAAHIKDVLALLKFAQNPRGRMAGFRALQLIPGIGPATATRLLDLLSDAGDTVGVIAGFAPPSSVSSADWQPFVDTMRGLASGAWPADLELARSWYRPHLERLHDDFAQRAADLDQLMALAQGFASRERFLTELSLDPPEATSDRSAAPRLDEDYLVLSTIHSAKGQEWKAVYVLNAVDGCIPSDMATGSREDIEEERRLLYVAMTRARDNLSLVVPHRFYVTQQTVRGDRHVYASRTRFIPERDMKHYQRVSWPPPEAAPAVRVAGPAMDLRSRARAAWQ